jgi:hypothetical protein
MTDTNKARALAERLVDHSTYYGGNTFDLLTAAPTTILALVDRLEEVEKHNEVLRQKIDAEKSCACGYDTADDVCAVHSPIVADLKARLAEVEQERDAMIEHRAQLQRDLATATEALRQLLDDMGEVGQCVCLDAKEQAQAALSSISAGAVEHPDSVRLREAIRRARALYVQGDDSAATLASVIDVLNEALGDG